MPNPSRYKLTFPLLTLALLIIVAIAIPVVQEPGPGEPGNYGTARISKPVSDMGPNRNFEGPQLLETESFYRMPNGTLAPVPEEDLEDEGRGSEDKQPFTHQDTRMVPREELVIVGDNNIEFIDDHLDNYPHITDLESQEDDFDEFEPATGDFDGDGRAETAILGLHDGDLSLWVLDDRKEWFSNMSNGLAQEKILGIEDDEDVWGIHRDCKSIATGDIDGDGLDEIAVVTPVIEWIEFDEPIEGIFGDITGMFGTFVRVILFDDADEDFKELTNWNIGSGYLPDITMGDMNGDARDEIIFTATEANKWDVNLFLFEYNETSQVKMSPLIRNKEAQEYWSGGEDSDFWWGKEVNVGEKPKDGNQRQDSDVITGDIDGDGLQEVIVLTGAHERLDEEEDMSTVMDVYDYLPEENNVSRYKKTPDSWQTFHDDSGWLRLRVKTGDIDGDMMDEIIVGGPWDDDIDAWVFDDAQHSFKQMKRWDDNDGDLGASDPDKARGGRRSHVRFDVGDVDCDGKDEIVFVTEERGSKKPSFFFGLFGGGDTGSMGHKVWVYDDVKGMAYWKEGEKEFSEADMPLLTSFKIGSDMEYPLLALGDIDGDGIVLQYNGDHTVKISKPRPIAVLAAPPQYMPNGPPGDSDVFPQNYAFSGTTYGLGSTTGSGTSKSHTDSVHVGASVSLGYKWPGASVMATFTTTMNWEFTQTNSNTELITMAREFNGDSDGDTIIYQTVKFDVYNYTVTSHPDKKAIGSYTLIEVPRRDWWYKEYVEYYNEIPYIQKHPEYQIGKDIFKHQVGKPWTYPTVAEADDIMAKAESMKWAINKEKTYPFNIVKEPRCRYPEYCGGWQSEALYVGHGGGTQSVTIDLSKEQITENAKTFGMDFDLTVEAEFGGAGVSGGFGVSAGYGFSNTHSSSIITGEETVYRGTVGDIYESQAYEDYGYGFGLFVYNHKRAPDFGFQVLNFVVADFNMQAAVGARADVDCTAALDMEPSGKYLPDKCLFKNNAKVHGAKTEKGVNGNALKFDGTDDYVSFEEPLFIAPPGNLTVSANIKPDNLENGTIVYGGDRGEYKLYLENGTLVFAVRLGAQVGWESEEKPTDSGRGDDVPLPPPSDNLTILDQPQWIKVDYPFDIPPDDWKRVTATYSFADKIILYIDGEEVANETMPAFPIHDPGRNALTSIGSTNGSEGEFFAGSIDDVIILKRIMNDTNETRNVEHFLLVTSSGTYRDGETKVDDIGDGAQICMPLFPLLILLVIALLLLYWTEVLRMVGLKKEHDEECIYCGSHEELQHGHLVAPSKGGQKPVIACAKCNLSKGDKGLMEWLRWTKLERPERWELIVDWNKEPKEGEVPVKVRKVRDEKTRIPEPERVSTPREPVDDGDRCIYCGATGKLTKEHVVSKGREPENACTGCHLSRSDKSLEEWLDYVKENKDEKWEAIVTHNKGQRGEVPEHVRAIRDQKPDTCIYCGSHEEIVETTIVAASKGGKKPVAACEQCFRSKGTKALMEWLRWTKVERPERWDAIVEFNQGKQGEVPQKVHTVRDEPVKERKTPPEQKDEPKAPPKPKKASKKASKKVSKKESKPKEKPKSKPKSEPKQKPKSKAEPTEEPKAETCVYCGASGKLTNKHVMAEGQKPTTSCISYHLSRKKAEGMEEWFAQLKKKKPEKWEAILGQAKGKRTKLAKTIRKIDSMEEA